MALVQATVIKANDNQYYEEFNEDDKEKARLMNDYLKPALDLGLIEMTQPNSPKSPTQKYKVKDIEE